MPGRSSIQENMVKALYLLITKVPMPRILKAKVPAWAKFWFRRLSSSFKPTSYYQIFQLRDIKEMDEELLGSFIRHNAHILDKVSKTMWTRGKATSYSQGKCRLIEAIEDWHRRGLDTGDDIIWAQEIIERYNKWEEAKKLADVIVGSGEKEEKADIYNVIKSRRSIRYFERKDIEDGEIMSILEAGKWAPCSGNRQAWKFIVQKRAKGSYSAKPELDFEKERHRQGAVVIYVAIDERLYPEKYTAAMDAAAAIQNMLLMAHHLGIGGCWLYLAELVNQDKLREKLGIDDYYYTYSAILLGYPGEHPEAPGRKPLDKIVKFIGFDPKGAVNDG